MTSVAPATVVPPVDPDREPGVATAEAAGLDFWDLVDVINPLQHIPIVSSLYRALTGDTIKPAMMVFGGALFGGPVGFLAGVASAVIEQTTGREPGAQLIALLRGETSPATPLETLAASGPPLSLLPPTRARAVAGAFAPAAPPPWLGLALTEAQTPPEERAPQP